jgi:putative transposase
LEVNEVKRLRQREDENRRLTQIVADLTLDNAALKDVLAKNCNACCSADHCCLSHHPAWSLGAAGVSPDATRALDVRYQSRRVESSEPHVRFFAAALPRLGHRQIGILLWREFGALNHKHVYRLSHAEGLSV